MDSVGNKLTSVVFKEESIISQLLDAVIVIFTVQHKYFVGYKFCEFIKILIFGK